MKFIHSIDNFLNKFTMYRVVLYSLLLISAASIILSLFGQLSYNWFDLLLSATLLTVTCYLINHIFARLFKAVPNAESSLITGLILFLIMQPAENLQGLLGLILVSVVSMGSKYILAIHKKHIFNPAALAAFVLGFQASTAAIWWVATPALLPFTAFLGLLIVRKIRRFRLFISFLIPAFVSIVAFGFVNGVGDRELLAQAFTSWPLIFFGTVMLTEPRTMPPTKKLQMIYAGLIGVLFGFPFSLGQIFSTPELSLLIGNILSFLVSPKQNLLLKFEEMKKLAPDIYGLSFVPDQKLTFLPGQYLEWTLPIKASDSRGNRRYFTIASSPTDDKIQLGVKISENSSSFKKTLLSIKLGDKLSAASLSGDFTIPENKDEKLVFIAGGIGITPFRSIIQYLLDTKQKRDIVLFYVATYPSDFVYKDIFEKAGYTTGLKTVYVVTKAENAPKKDWNGKTGRINEEMIRHEVPDFKQRKFYLSGPNSMVQAYKEMLSSLGVPKNKIVTDYFPGF